eukprot:205418-Rhodomonas_salina.2
MAGPGAGGGGGDAGVGGQGFASPRLQVKLTLAACRARPVGCGVLCSFERNEDSTTGVFPQSAGRSKS